MKMKKQHQLSEYRYREGAHGEHFVDYGRFVWQREETIGRAVSLEDAIKIVDELNSLNRALVVEEKK